MIKYREWSLDDEMLSQQQQQHWRHYSLERRRYDDILVRLEKSVDNPLEDPHMIIII